MTSAPVNITTQAVADHFGVDPTTVRNWANDGKIPFTKTPGGQYRFPRSVIEDDAEEAKAS